MAPSTVFLRRGFTLVELLVVITIIGILVSLLLPAVNSARESGRMAVCRNNLKQIGLAMQHHLTDHSTFPAGGWGWGWVGDADRGTGFGQPGGWIYNTLNYVEQQPLHDLGMGTDPTGTNPTNSTKMALNTQRAGTPLGGFLCPSRRAVALYPFTSAAANYNPASLNPSNMVAKTDYAANGGDNFETPSSLGIWANCFDNADGGPSPSSIPSAQSLVQLNQQVVTFGVTGIVAAMMMTSANEITDGMSNTYLVGEKYLEPEMWKTGQDGCDNECAYIGDNPDITRFTSVSTYSSDPNCTTCLPPIRDRHNFGYWSYSFGSSHVAGFHMCMCDGSVRPISYSINPAVHRLLGNKSDGNAVVPGTSIPIEPPQ